MKRRNGHRAVDKPSRSVRSTSTGRWSWADVIVGEFLFHALYIGRMSPRFSPLGRFRPPGVAMVRPPGTLFPLARFE